MIKTCLLLFFSFTLFSLDLTYKELTSIDSTMTANQKHVLGSKILVVKEQFGKKYIVIHDLLNKNKTKEVIDKKQKKHKIPMESEQQIEIANKNIIQFGFINQDYFYINYVDNLIEIYAINQKNQEPEYINSCFLVKDLKVINNNIFILYKNLTIKKYNIETKKVDKFDIKDLFAKNKISYNKSYIIDACIDINSEEKVIFSDNESAKFFLIDLKQNQVTNLAIITDNQARAFKFAESNNCSNKFISPCKVNNDNLIKIDADIVSTNADVCCITSGTSHINICAKNKSLIYKGNKAYLSNNGLAIISDKSNSILLDISNTQEVFKFNLQKDENLFLSINGDYLFSQTNEVIKVYQLPTREELEFYFKVENFSQSTNRSKKEIAIILSQYLNNISNFVLTNTTQQ